MSTNRPGPGGDRPAKAQRRDAAREKARRLREQAERRRRRNQRLLVAAAVAAVLLVVVTVGAIIQAGRSSVPPAATSAAPANVVDGGVVSGTSTGVPQVEVYLDYACPICGEFERSEGAWLQGRADAGEITLSYKPIAILDRYSSTKFSTRAAGAAGCVADTSPQAFPDFNAEMFAQQQPEQGPGLSDQQISQIAARVGASADTEQCIADQRFTGWAASTTDAASRAGVNGTPTVLVDGTQVSDRSQAGIEAAIQAAG